VACIILQFRQKVAYAALAVALGLMPTTWIQAEPAPSTGDVDGWQAPASANRKGNPVPGDATSVAYGKVIYIRECLTCHGAAGHGDGMVARALARRPADFSNGRLAQQTDGALFWKISVGHNPMPAWRALLSETDRWHAVNYLRTFTPPPPPPPPVPPTTQPATAPAGR